MADVSLPLMGSKCDYVVWNGEHRFLVKENFSIQDPSIHFHIKGMITSLILYPDMLDLNTICSLMACRLITDKATIPSSIPSS